jgi:hypothetical protein
MRRDIGIGFPIGAAITVRMGAIMAFLRQRYWHIIVVRRDL